jgi:prepilin-type N-terminal cleavage/methylation domain-containing protein
MNERGITLLELLIAMAITLVVTASAYNFYLNSFNFVIQQGRTTGMQQEIRAAVDIMSRDIRNAGLGVIDPLTGTIQGVAQPIQAGNNVDTDAAGNANVLDRIILIGGYRTVGILNATAALGASQITLLPVPGVSPASPTIVGQTITLEGFYTGTVTAMSGPAGGVYTLTLNPSLNRAYTQLDSVIVVQTVTYHVAVPPGETEPALYRNDGTVDQVIASGIEDLQFHYFLTGGLDTNAPAAVTPPAVSPIRAVRISLLARSRDPDKNKIAVSNRQALEDHPGVLIKDRYHRRTIIKVAEVRNLGLQQ